MTNEEAKVFLDNLKICINEHPIVADWLVEIANRKTENSSKKPNNSKVSEKPTGSEKPNNSKVSEKPTGSTISKMEQVETMSCAECKHRPIGAEICEEPCHYEPQTDWHYDEQDATWYPYKHEDEPQQKSCATCKHALGNWDGESNNCGRCCGADRRFYEPKDEQTETKTETQNSNLTFEKDECAKEYEELGLKQLKELIEADHKDEPTCDTCRHKGVEGCEQPCLGCGCCGLYEAMTGNDKLKEKVVEFIKSCARCKHRPIGAMMCEESCHYEPKDEQTDCPWK